MSRAGTPPHAPPRPLPSRATPSCTRARSPFPRTPPAGPPSLARSAPPGPEPPDLLAALRQAPPALGALRADRADRGLVPLVPPPLAGLPAEPPRGREPGVALGLLPLDARLLLDPLLLADRSRGLLPPRLLLAPATLGARPPALGRLRRAAGLAGQRPLAFAHRVGEENSIPVRGPVLPGSAARGRLRRRAAEAPASGARSSSRSTGASRPPPRAPGRGRPTLPRNAGGPASAARR